MKRSIASFLLGCCWLSAHGALQLQALHTTAAGNPATSLVQGTDGNFYGTLSNSVFRLTPSGTFSTLGSVPLLEPGLALAQDGNLYGMSRSGPLGYGAIFRVTPPAQITYVYNFGASDGKPLGLRAGLDGFLYGACLTTNGSPSFEVWSVFQFDTNGAATVLRLITNSGSFGFAGADFTLPVQGVDGSLYGSFTGNGHSGFETGRAVFYRLTTTGSYQVLSNVTTSASASSDLVFGADGWLYGVLGTRGYPAGLGSVFRISTNGIFTNLYEFSSTNGADPQQRLFPAADGALYGTTYSGGTSNLGTIFRITTNGTLTTLISFQGSGGRPQAPLTQSNDGIIYGTTAQAGFPYTGIIFRLVETPVISSLTFTNGGAALTWNSFTNGLYRLDYKSGVSDPTWLTLIPSITATDVTTSAADSSPAGDQRFYRVVLLP